MTHWVGWGDSIHEVAWGRPALRLEALEEYHLEVVGR